MSSRQQGREYTIGNNVDLTPGVRILTEQHDVDSPDYDTVKRPVVIDDHVVVGSWAWYFRACTWAKARSSAPAAWSRVTCHPTPWSPVTPQWSSGRGSGV